jgi:hypothetical protein
MAVEGEEGEEMEGGEGADDDERECCLLVLNSVTSTPNMNRHLSPPPLRRRPL